MFQGHISLEESMFSKSSQVGTQREPTGSYKAIGMYLSFGFAMALAIQASAAQISLTWDASPTTSVTGYNIYSRAYTGTYTAATNVGNSLSYTIGTLASGQSLTSGQNYCFVVTAYNAAAIESTPSNEVCGAAPTATTANFSASPTSGTAPLNVTFNNTSTGASACSWTFGDGTSANGNCAATTAHTYSSAGTYSVTLNATGTDGTKTKTTANYIVVTAPSATANQPPIGNISSPSANISVPQGSVVNFQGTGSDPDNNTPLSYAWSFGGGAAASTLQSPSVTFATAGTYTVTLTVRDAKSLAATTPATRIVTVTAPANTAPIATIWPATATPSNITIANSTALSLGVKFTASQNGSILGIRFYKGSGNTGTHVGSLWTSTGRRLAAATFTNETASGWQEVRFATPVAIKANTVYVASYFAPNGHISWDDGYFSNASYTSGPLTALKHTSATPNGVYAIGSQAIFPNRGDYPANFWIDVVFRATN
jgi:PKD repeat protein